MPGDFLLVSEPCSVPVRIHVILERLCLALSCYLPRSTHNLGNICPRGDHGYFLDHLLLPSLCDFKYCDQDTDRWDQSRFLSLLSRSSCSIRRLDIHISVYPSILGDDFVRIPDLEDLAFVVGKGPGLFTTAVLARLKHAIGDGEPCLVPKLRTLKLDHGDVVDYDELADMIESRWRLGCRSADSSSESGARGLTSRIRAVEVRYLGCEWDVIDQLVLLRLREFVDEGLNLQMETFAINHEFELVSTSASNI